MNSRMHASMLYICFVKCHYRTASLLHPARCYAPPPPPPPYFRAKLLYRVILPPLHAPPPRAARAGLRYAILHAVLARVCVLQV